MQIIWAVLLVAFTLPNSIAEPTVNRVVWASFAVVLTVASLGCFRSIRLCWGITLLCCLVAMVFWSINSSCKHLYVLHRSPFVSGFPGHHFGRGGYWNDACLAAVFNYQLCYIGPVPLSSLLYPRHQAAERTAY